MAWQYLKRSTAGSIFIMTLSIIASEQPLQHDSVTKILANYRSSLTQQALGMGPTGVQDFSTIQPVSQNKKTSKKIFHQHLQLIIASKCCSHCIRNAFTHNEEKKYSYRKCSESEICALTAKIDTLFEDKQLLMGSDYWYMKFTSWDLSKWILEMKESHQSLSSNDLSILKSILDGINADNINDKNLQRLIELAITHNNWCRTNAGYRSPFFFSFENNQYS